MRERGRYDDGRGEGRRGERRALDTNGRTGGIDRTVGVFYRHDARGKRGEDCEDLRRATGSVDGDGVGILRESVRFMRERFGKVDFRESWW